MPFTPKFVDLVRNFTTVQGTGPVALGASVSGFTSINDALSAGDQFYYCIQSVDSPLEREVGRGTLQANGTVARQPISGVPTNFSKGTKTIALVTAAEWFSKFEAAGSGGMAAVANRTELAAGSGGRAYLAEPKHAGNFIFDAANHAAKVAADTRQALYVAPASDPSGASGAWVRQFDGAVNVKWFGAIGDGTTNDGAAFTAALALLKHLAINDDVYYKGSAKLLVPAGHYYLATTTLDITHTLILEGESGIGGGISTLLRWADNTTGIRIQGHNTNGAAGTDPAPFHYSGAGSLIRNISLRGGFSGAEGEFHGIHVRAGLTIENFWIDNFPGDGIFAHTSVTGGGAEEGNSNGMAIRRGRITNVRDGFGIDGADANVWLVEGVDVTYARRWGVWDSSFLGNTYINVHVANAGLVPGNPPTVVHYLGNRFFVKVGQATGASTNAPPSSATDNAFWGCMGAGGEALFVNIPTWTSGLTVREGGGFKTDSLNARNQLIGCYTEGGQAPSQLIAPTLVIGGLWGADIVNTDPSKDPATILAGDGSTKFPLKAEFSDLRIARQVSTGSIFTLHNRSAMTAGYRSRQDFAIGFEADGTTPAAMASIYAYSNTGSPATAEGQLILATRAYTTGVMTDRLQLDGANMAFSPTDDLGIQLGGGTRRFKEIHAGPLGFKVNGLKVVGAQGAALPADATDLASALTLINAIKARIVAHGLVAA